MEYSDWLLCDIAGFDFGVPGNCFFAFQTSPKMSPTPARPWVFVLVISTAMDAVSKTCNTGRSKRRLRSKVLPLAAARWANSYAKLTVLSSCPSLRPGALQNSTASSVSCSRISGNSWIETSPIAVPSGTAVAVMTDTAVSVLSGALIVVANGS